MIPNIKNIILIIQKSKLIKGILYLIILFTLFLNITISIVQYLKKVKNCPEKDMNEGLVAYLRGDVPTAMRLVEQARQGGVIEAEAQMKEFSRLKINKK